MNIFFHDEIVPGYVTVKADRVIDNASTGMLLQELGNVIGIDVVHIDETTCTFVPDQSLREASEVTMRSIAEAFQTVFGCPVSIIPDPE